MTRCRRLSIHELMSAGGLAGSGVCGRQGEVLSTRPLDYQPRTTDIVVVTGGLEPALTRAQIVAENLLYYGDNLDVLRRHIKDESVDLVYLDPPFNSNASYNVLFAEKDGHGAAGQIQAFEDTWHWDEAAAKQYELVVEQGGRVSDVLRAFREFLGTNDMLAYLAMMASRLAELRRVLKPTGSLYLHCDPTASHYLKLLLDAVFGVAGYCSEIIWKRTGAHSSARRPGPVHDVILFYAKSGDYTWNQLHTPHDPEYLASHYTQVDQDGRRWMADNLTAAGVRHGSSGQPWRGFDVAAKGNHWKFTHENLERLDKEGRIYWPAKEGGWPRYKRLLDEMKGKPIQDIWDDIPPVNAVAAERLGYPTQKPEALLERIIALSSNEGDTVLDPFCGCGTTVAAAQTLKRRWIGIDVTHLSIALIKHRLETAFGAAATYRVVGEPTTVDDAKVLADSDPYQFQWWALGLVGARGVEKKGADKGIDGRLFWHEGDGKTRQLIISVKAGNLHRSQVHELRGVVEREKADLGVLVSFDAPTRPMREDAASAGFYTSPWGKHARIQLLTVADLLAGKGIDYPRTAGTNVTLKAAPRAREREAEVFELDFAAPPLRKVAEPTHRGYRATEGRKAKKAKKPRNGST